MIITSLRHLGLVLIAITTLAACSQTQPVAPPIAATQVPTATPNLEPVPKEVREKIGVRPVGPEKVKALGFAMAGDTRWSLVGFHDGNGAFCVAVDSPSREGTPACDIELPEAHPINMAMEVVDDKTIFLYGGARAEVRDVYLSDTSGSHKQRLYAYPSEPDQWFFIPIKRRSIKGITAALPGGRSYSVEPEVVKAVNAAVSGEAPPTSSRTPTVVGPGS